jgi:Rod binding domain-containing protein
VSLNLVTPNLSATWGSRADVGVRPTSETLEKAARQFEALVLSQLLKSARESSPGGLMGDGGDQASSTLSGLADEHFAQALAARGGLGLASIVSKGLIAAGNNGKGSR